MKMCEKCGKNYSDSQNFCASCGGKLTAVQAEAVQMTAQPVAAAVGTTQSTTTPTSSSNGFAANNWMLFAAIIGYLLSWVDGWAILGTAIAAGTAGLGWMKTEDGYACKNIAARIVATVIGGLSVLELFIYGLL